MTDQEFHEAYISAIESYLKEKELYHAFYNQRITTTDHDHCEFCGKTFSDLPDTLKEGYCTSDFYYWVSEDCFERYKDRFQWTVKDIRNER